MNWQDALREVVNEYQEVEFGWGEHDCLQFVSAYVKAKTGIDHASAFHYSNEEEALDLMDESIEQLIVMCLGAPQETFEPGDVVLCHVEDLLVPGIWNGSYVWAFVKERGLSRMTEQSIIRAWSV